MTSLDDETVLRHLLGLNHAVHNRAAVGRPVSARLRLHTVQPEDRPLAKGVVVDGISVLNALMTIRRRRKLTLAQLASRMRVTPAAVRNLVGRSNRGVAPRLDTLAEVAEGLNVEITFQIRARARG